MDAMGLAGNVGDCGECCWMALLASVGICAYVVQILSSCPHEPVVFCVYAACVQAPVPGSILHWCTVPMRFGVTRKRSRDTVTSKHEFACFCVQNDTMAKWTLTYLQ